MLSHRSDGAVPPDEVDWPPVGSTRDQPRPAQHSAYVPIAELTVLRRERVDGGRDHPHPLRRHPVRDIARSREHERVRVREVATQELPPGVRVGGGVVAADVTAPNHLGAGLVETLDQSGSLRVVQKHDVAGPNLGRQIDQVPFEHPFIVLVFRRSECLPAVRRAVQGIVHSFGDGEELMVAVQNQPPGVDSRAASVCNEALQHLRHPATVRGGVDVPHHPTGEKSPGPGSGGQQLAPLGRRQNRLQQVKRHRLDLDLLHLSILPASNRFVN